METENSGLEVISDKIISEIQAGFRAGFCTMDHIFTLMCIMGLYKKYKENLFIAFIDYQKAFDTIWRAGLWNKLVKEGVKGKFLNIIKDMYKKSKSCVFLNNKKSGSFASYAGVRQGEILSPLLFAFYINDLENFMKSKEILPLTALKDISVDVSNLIDPEWDIYLELLTLFYADDTIIFAETAYSLQLALDELKNYCTDWKLTVNEDKTKIMCVTVKRTEEPDFFYNGKKLEVVEEFTYLGVNFTKKGISNKSVSARILPTQKAMFSTLNKCKAANLPIDLTLDLFTKMVAPCMMYGGEIWGFKNVQCLEKVQLKYLKYALKLKSSTSTNMLYGETGFLPIEFYAKVKMITYWISIVSGSQDKLSFKLYIICLFLYKENCLDFEWLKCVENTINDCGLAYVFEGQLTLDAKWLKNVFLPDLKMILKKQIIQKWELEVRNASKCFYYRHICSSYTMQHYLRKMPPEIWIPLIKLRTANHKLPVEIYSWSILYRKREKRLCSLCDKEDVGDEYHYIMVCPFFQAARDEFFPKYFRKKPSVFKFLQLVDSNNATTLKGLARFLNILFSIFK